MRIYFPFAIKLYVFLHSSKKKIDKQTNKQTIKLFYG